MKIINEVYMKQIEQTFLLGAPSISILVNKSLQVLEEMKAARQTVAFTSFSCQNIRLKFRI